MASVQVASRNSPSSLTDERRRESIRTVEVFETEPALVGQPAAVGGVVVDSLEAEDLVLGGVDRDRVPHRAMQTGRLDLLQVPRTGSEPIRAGSECPHRTDLHGVAGEVRRERLIGEGLHLGVVSASDELDERIARDLFGEAGAPGTEDASLSVEQHQIRDRNRLFVVALLLDEAALPGPARHRLILQRAFTALVAHGAVERVVDEQEFEDPLLCLLDGLPTGCGPPSRRRRAGCRT